MEFGYDRLFVMRAWAGMRSLYAVMPDASAIAALAPPELAFVLLPILKREQTGGSRSFNTYNLENELRNGRVGENFVGVEAETVGQALREAFAWLSAQGLIVAAPYDSQGGNFVLSRRAAAVAEGRSSLKSFVAAQRLHRESLNPRIAETVWSAFLRGEYDVAVFQAMKAVEVAVREAARGDAGDIGVALMRKAFHPTNGALTDMSAEAGERDARAAMFAGAIGSYKNPHSHRDVDVDDPDEALELILFANHLLRIVDTRSSAVSTE